MNSDSFRAMSSQSANQKEGYVSWTKEVNESGEFKRKPRTFRNVITADGSSGFKAEKDRYHLYVSFACTHEEFSSTKLIIQVPGPIEP